MGRKGLLPTLFGTMLLCLTSFEGQAQEHIYVRDADTLHYSYTPIEEPQPAPEKKPGFLRRMVRYFERAAEDHTFEKKIDFTFAGGIGYSKNTNVTFALLAAGLYRVDRTDSITPPSNFTVFGSASVVGYYAFGVTGTNLWRKSRQRLNYKVDFSSSPRDVWGRGFEAGRDNGRQDFVEKEFKVDLDFQQRLFRHTYAGIVMNFQHTRGKDFDNDIYLRTDDPAYSTTGLGLVVEYDSRDLSTNPQKGAYISLKGTIFPKGLGTQGATLWRSNFTIDLFQRLWQGAILGMDIAGEFNSKGAPWTMLAKLGGSNRMRGYYKGQYTDNSILTAQMELRQHIWRRIGGVVWVGGGNVFPDLRSFNWRHTLPNYGLGLRWTFKKGMNVRIDYGFGKHTSGLVLNINEAF